MMLESEEGNTKYSDANWEKMEMSKLASKIRFEDEVKRLGCVQLLPETIQILFATEKN